MTMTQRYSRSEGVTAHIKQLDPQSSRVVELIRAIILAADPAIGERIKWNNPSFFYTGGNEPFDARKV